MPDTQNSGTGDPAFGLRLKRSREAIPLSQTQLAERVGVQQGTVSAYESGAAMPAAKGTLPALAMALRTSLDFLLIGLRERMPPNAVETLLKKIPGRTWRKLGKLTPAELALVARQIGSLVNDILAARRSPKGPRT